MADSADGLFAIEVDTDDYAETAAADTPTVSRTFQSETAFQAQKASYTAKIDDGDIHAQLIQELESQTRQSEAASKLVRGNSKVKLSKKETVLLGYAVGELYYLRNFQKGLEVCEWVLAEFEMDGRGRAGVEKWRERFEGRVRSAGG
ncbi:hypothetical protein B0A50_07509 [Salinomyces thailandicus]|uniref:Uncharacterized protein n=1 Tax=Salinomyces thailandicus TaxID=706561 RepID=A0A4U0TNX8_9PEZI|nr:hypothetical protein B0A50_07509 [Salinomyces thailandica]